MHSNQAPDALAHWDDFRLFGETAKAGSFSAAARRLNTTQRTVSRRIHSLEQRLGVRLFDRLPHGVVPTAEGQKVFDAVQRVDDTFVDIQRRVVGSDRRCEGPVRLSLTEGLANFWLTPRLGGLQERHPGISVELFCSLEPADVLNMESDVAIQFRRPLTPDVVAFRLGTLHLVPWASPGYLDARGTPTSAEELRNHRLLDCWYYHYNSDEYTAWQALRRAGRQAGYWTNSSTSLLSAVQNGLGIALLPTYFCEAVKGIVPLDLGLRSSVSFWLSYHPGIKGAARVRAVIDWIKSLFDHDACPWFRDDFHPPKPPAPESDPPMRPAEVPLWLGTAV